MIGIVKTSSQNLKSIINVLNFLNVKSELINNVKKFHKFEKIILPGVGSFDPVINSIKKLGLDTKQMNNIFFEKQIFGICIGLQVLCNRSEEGKESGFNLINAEVKNLRSLNCTEAVPHVGFNKVELNKNDEKLKNIFKNKFYFTHSYGVEKNNLKLDNLDNYGITEYGGCKFISFIKIKNSIATQFHPEKSGKAGIELLKFFCDQ